jgi:eukaryotic-like serine/threonine-protein kinase
MSGDLVGQSIAHFRIVEKIGEGGMGVVYKAYDEKLGRAVALKVLPEPFATSEQRRQRFLREAKSAAAVTHSNIATIYEVGESVGRVFIAMELIEGASLREVIEKQVSVPEALRIAGGIALGLSRAHGKGIIHRDLKPENVMVTPQGDVKILDFGIAKLEDTKSASGDAKTEQQLTREGSVLGTPAYSSPEQARGERVDARSDVFSFGVMLYETLTGVKPFPGETAVAIAIASMLNEPAPVRQLNPEVPAEVERIVARCLEKLPGARYANGQEIAAALGALEPGTSHPPTERSSAPATASSRDASGPSASQATPAPSSLGAPRRKVGRPWLLPILLGLGLVVIVGIEGLRLRSRSPAGTGAADKDALTQQTPASGAGLVSAPQAITDLPPPASRSPEALDAYKQGMQLMRDGAPGGAMEMFEHALKLDGSMAAAELRSALLSFALNLNEEQPKQLEHFKAAVAGRGSLGEHDRILLDAMEPSFRHPRELAESERRVRPLLVRSPDDVDFLFWHALLLYATGSIDESLRLYARMTALDPAFGLAWARYGAVFANLSSRAEDAFRELDKCVSARPNATQCMHVRMKLEANEGLCDRMEADARRLVSLEDEDPRWVSWLGTAIYATGSPLSAVRSAEEQAEARTAADERTSLVLHHQWSLDVLGGDFVRARERLDAIHGLVEHEVREPPHLDYAYVATALALETGNPARAVSVARDYLDHVDAWSMEGWAGDAGEGRMSMWNVLYNAGGTTAEELARHHDDWLRKARATDRWASNTPFFWLETYAAFPAGPTPAQAAEAIVALPQYENKRAIEAIVGTGAPLFGAVDHKTDDDLVIGTTYLLARQLDEGLSYLKRAASSCRAIDFPVAHTQAQFWLGEALEQKNDVEGACAAYKVVLDRWGHAKPRSVTGEKARKRVAALACAK